MWPHPGDGPSDDSSIGSSNFEPHTESTAGQPLGLLHLVRDLQRQTQGEFTTLNDGLNTLLYQTVMLRKLHGGRSLVKLFNLRGKTNQQNKFLQKFTHELHWFLNFDIFRQ